MLLNQKKFDDEQEVLSALIFNPNKIYEYNITSDLFDNENNKVIFKAMTDARRDGQDPINLIPKELGNYYSMLLDGAFTATNFCSHYERLLDGAQNRKIEKHIQDWQNGLIDLETLLTVIRETMSKAPSTDTVIDPESIVHGLIRPDDILECPGFIPLCQNLQISKGSFNLIGATSGIGKSSFAINLFSGFVENRNYFPIYFNLEMSEKVIQKRVTAIRTDIPIRNLKDPNNRNQITECWKRLQDLGFMNSQIQTGSKSINDIRSAIAKAAYTNPGRHVVAFIDLLSHITGFGSKTEREQLSEISKSLLAITKDFDCSIFLLQQLNRQAYGNPKAGQDTFKGSGQTVEDSDNALILSDLSKEHGHESDLYHYFKISVSKARNGTLHTIFAIRVKMDTQKYDLIRWHDLPDWVNEKGARN